VKTENSSLQKDELQFQPTTFLIIFNSIG